MFNSSKRKFEWPLIDFEGRWTNFLVQAHNSKSIYILTHMLCMCMYIYACNELESSSPSIMLPSCSGSKRLGFLY